MLRIGIAPCEKIGDYVEAVSAEGVEPIVLDLASRPAGDLLTAIDGIVLTGGGDVDPAYYGEPRHAAHSAAEPGRDAAEIALVRQAIASGTPLLAICRGVQVLNVAGGGSLVQDIPTEVPGALEHQVKHPRNALAHDVEVTPGSALARLLGGRLQSGRVAVNSRHHQAVKLIAPGFRVVATARDGVIEGIETTGSGFCLGVQWHPENFHGTGDFRALFDGLFAAARSRR
jgi:putative glutamine amidotransferase